MRLAGTTVMKKLLFVLFSCSIACASAQDNEPVVSKEEISVHSVERGSMSIFSPARGSVTSLEPRRALLSFDGDAEACDAGRAARLVTGDNQRALAAKVVGPANAGRCEVEFVDPLPDGSVVGQQVSALIVTRELKDVVFFGRPAGSQPNTTATIFLIEAPRMPAVSPSGTGRCRAR